MTRTLRMCAGLAIAAALIHPSSGSAQPAKTAAPTTSAAPVKTAAPITSAAPLPSAAPSASAAPSSTAEPLYEIAESDRMFSEGRKAFKDGLFDQALDRFQKSYALDPTPGILLNIALTEEKLGRPAAALQHFERVVGLFKPDDDRLPIARDGITRVALRAPRLRIDRAAGAPPTLAITLDGEALAAHLVGVDMPIEAGAHVVTARVPGFEERRYQVTLTEGQRAPIAVGPGARLSAPPAPVGTTRPAAPATQARMAVFALGGAGVAALGTGVVTGILAIGKASEYMDIERDPERCREKADCARVYGQGETLTNVATGALVFGGIAVAAGALVFFTTGRDAFSLSAGVGPGAGSLTASGRF